MSKFTDWIIALTKADTAVADALTKKHSNSLDHSNANDLTAEQKTALIGGGETVLHSHAGSGGMEQHGNEYHTPDMAEATHTHAGVYESADAAIQVHITAPHAPSNAQANADITKAEIEAKLTGEIASHSHAGGGGDGEQTVVATQDTPNATVNLANATGLTFNALANSTYIIEVFLVWTASATAVGIKVSATATNSPTIIAGHFITDAANGTPDSSTFNANDVVVTTSASPFTANNLGQLAGILKTAGNASVWQLRFAAETTGTITVKIGSTLRYRKVA